MSALSDLLAAASEDEIQQLAARIWPGMRPQIDREIRQVGPPTVLFDNARVTADVDGNELWASGQGSRFPILNFQNVTNGGIHSKTQRNQVDIPVGTPGPCVDYVVDADGNGTHLTLGGTAGAFQAAVADASGRVNIFLCNDETLTREEDMGGVSDKVINIIGWASGMGREGGQSSDTHVTITAAANSDMFKNTTAIGNNCGLVFTNIGLTPVASSGIFSVENANTLDDLEFQGCRFEGGSSWVVTNTGNIGMGVLDVHLRNSVGTLSHIARRTGSTATMPNRVRITDRCDLTLAQVWSGSATVADPNFVEVEDSRLTVSAQQAFSSNASTSFHFHNLYVQSSFAGDWISCAAARTNVQKMSFQSIVFRATTALANFANINGDAGSPSRYWLFDDIFGYATTGSPTGPFITLGSGTQQIHVGDVHAPQWATVISNSGTNNTISTVHSHELTASFDWASASTTTPAVVVRAPHAGSILGVYSKTAENITIGATAWVGDVHLIPVANANTDGQGTSIFTTKPTITNGNMYQAYGAPDLTTTFAAGDWLAFYTDQVGTNATFGTMVLEVRYT